MGWENEFSRVEKKVEMITRWAQCCKYVAEQIYGYNLFQMCSSTHTNAQS